MAGIKIRVVDNSQVFMRAKDTAVQEILNAIGETAVEHAQDLVPVDTGALHDSIGHEVDRKAVRIYASMPYASFVELGTSYQSAQPYLRPAVEDYVDEYESIAEDILRGGSFQKKRRITKR